MQRAYRLQKSHLLDVLETWDAKLRKPVLLAACGGTALTLYGHKESTKDVDFLIPIPDDYERIIKLITGLNYRRATGFGWGHPEQPWIFDLYRGQTIFETALLDPIQDVENHKVIKQFKQITLACIQPFDLIISKMFRGTMVDVDDCVIMIKSETLNLDALAQRYKETADYYIRPSKCKTNLQYLITELQMHDIDTTDLERMSATWNP
jgi:hypothetical protein